MPTKKYESVSEDKFHTKLSQPEDHLMADALGALSTESNVKNDTISITQSLINDESGNKSEFNDLKMSDDNIEANGSKTKET